ncbi:MAG: sigma-70 family RNA polymerase sigma factor [Candidatus Eisenbacteria bacterium]|nr:sigma-70 family RNA polymerase sigma factor [Candidatus Eisenbacteria bacterium]
MSMRGFTISRRAQIRSDDAELIREIAHGSEAAFSALFQRWSPRLGRFLQQATGSRESAEDLLQEAFLRILRAAPRFRARQSRPAPAASAWIYRICANLAYSHWRRRKASPVLDGWEVGALPERPTPEAADPERWRLRRAIAAEARAALARIPRNQRLVFLLKVDQGLTYEEISTVMGSPVGTAKSRFHHAVRKLQDLMRAWDESADSSDARRDDARRTRRSGRNSDVL